MSMPSTVQICIVGPNRLHDRAIEIAVCILSPVSTQIRSPAFDRASIVSGTPT